MMERKKKQSVPSTPSTLFGNMSRGKPAAQPTKGQDRRTKEQQAQTARNRLTTRALYDTEEEEAEETDESDRER